MTTAKTLIRLGGCPCWSESSLGTHDHSKDFDQTGWMPVLIWVFTRRTFCWFCHEEAQTWHTTHTWITMHYIRPFLYNIIKVSLPLSQCYFTKCTGYNTNCIIGVIMKSNQMDPKYNSYCNQYTSYGFVCLLVLRLNVPVNNFSVMSGQSHQFLGNKPVLSGSKVSCSRTQHSGGRFRTPDLSLQSPTLDHWATALLLHTVKLT